MRRASVLRFVAGAPLFLIPDAAELVGDLVDLAQLEDPGDRVDLEARLQLEREFRRALAWRRPQ